MAWVAWLGLAVLLGIAEAATLTFAFGLLAGAALVAAVVAGLGAPVLAQVLAFVLTGGVSLAVIRPIARRQMRQPPLLRDGTDALVGKTALVIHEVSARHGAVRLSGEEWTARPYDEHLVIPEGTFVDVMEIDGATAVVYPHEELS
ncbi:membrane protein implicated in regulation of membrane protease activity [Mumia flava]|uniref:Membrane protein implicated in regulation of membrane protease activity n=1 Tax=Mumia flava TaxID=1348852 RepID=A0A0B2BBA4_9ACTN|nr:NfeD family protein [Mumia flava]PJJ53963.1 membrane protein implicated in regulation of membrane protease activity [Mumia flava]